MSDAFAEQVKPDMPSLPPPGGQSITLSVTLHPNGKLEFSLPLGNKLLCYGLLEVARAQVDKLYLVQEWQQEHAARGGLEGFLRRMNGGN